MTDGWRWKDDPAFRNIYQVPSETKVAAVRLRLMHPKLPDDMRERIREQLNDARATGRLSVMLVNGVLNRMQTAIEKNGGAV